MQITTAALSLALALTASSTPLDTRQTPDRFGLFFAATETEPEAQILVTFCGQNTPQRECFVANANPEYLGEAEPLIFDKNFIYTSVTATPNGGQALLVNTENSQGLSLTVAHGGFVVPEGFTREGFSVIDGKLAFRGVTDHFYQCLMFIAPGGVFPLYANEPIDPKALGGAGCTQRDIVAKTSAVGK